MYSKSASSETRVDFGVELEEGLGYYSETAELVAPLSQLNQSLESAHDVCRKAEKAKARAMAGLRFTELGAETAVRAVANAIETHEGGRRGPVFAGVLPEGLNGVLAPTGTKQLAPVQAFRKRLADRPGIPETARAAWLATVDPALAALADGVKAYKDARTAWGEAFQAELYEREEHALLVDKLMGLVRAAFPGDRRKQNVIFPKVSSSRRKAPVEEGLPPDNVLPEPPVAEA